jgi:hypothetical protein
MFQPAISTAVAADLLVRFPTSARAGANDVGAGGSRENDQSGGSDKKACHGLNAPMSNDARREADTSSETGMRRQSPSGIRLPAHHLPDSTMGDAMAQPRRLVEEVLPYVWPCRGPAKRGNHILLRREADLSAASPDVF